MLTLKLCEIKTQVLSLQLFIVQADIREQFSVWLFLKLARLPRSVSPTVYLLMAFIIFPQGGMGSWSWGGTYVPIYHLTRQLEVFV